MAIQFIDNQPIYFTGGLPTDSPCKDQGCGSYCAPYQINDPISFQFKQTPCSNSNLFCNPTLENTNPELVANGDFAVSTGWTFGTGWAYSGSPNFLATRTGSTSSGSLTQTLSVTPGVTYQIKFDFWVLGTTNPPVGITVSLGGNTYSQTFYVSGTYYLNLVCGAGSTISFTTSLGVASIDNVSVRENIVGDNDSYCLYSTNPNYWVHQYDGTITHMIGDDAKLYTNIPITSSTGYIKVSFDVTGLVSGNMDIEWYDGLTFQTYIFGNVSSNGSFTFYTTYTTIPFATELLLLFHAGSDCGLTISNIVIEDMSLTSTIILKSTSGMGPDYSINTYGNIEYDKEYVTVTFDNTLTIPGEYQICIYDPCIPPSNVEMIPDYDISNCLWAGQTSNHPTSLICNPGQFSILVNSTQPDLIYEILPTWDSPFYNNNYGVYNYLIEGTVNSAGPSNEGIIYIWNTITNQPIYEIGRFYPSTTTFSFTGTAIIYKDQNGWDPIIRITMAYTPNDDTIDFQRFQITELYTDMYGTETCSNCINIQSTQPCTHWIEGECDQAAFGFNFNNFKIQGRVKSMFLNPKYKGEFKKYTDADGRSTVTRTTSNKIYEFLINYSPERAHDWLRLAMACDVINIGTSPSNTAQWVNTSGDYQPEWPDTLGNFPLAQCRLELQKKIDELYNNNAG